MLPLDHNGERVQKGDLISNPFSFQVTAHVIHSIKQQVDLWHRSLLELDEVTP